ncbi:MAG: LLM class flavin-dependent oxidoreductase [Pseudomonadales bacterium]|nr:LLM class flavin-dependent oxidoreductase [Pseudomonadales bacterium]HAO54202.1 alkane 1-monooxygenase [Gammaproteobacteria bacterium]
MATLSVLDLAPIVEGSDAGRALANSLDLAQHAEEWGYRRFWLAEHHNMQGIASSATAVCIGYVAQGTNTIRVGSGGVMLPNHAPLVIAEQFGTLASLYPGRIDLGLGRAPGTDQQTSFALRRNLQGNVDGFPRDVLELQNFLGAAEPGQKVRAVPGEGTKVPLWILGSSLYGAQLAAMLGLPFGFASHFAPAQMEQAIDIYRSRFQASETLSDPYVMLGFNVCAAPSEEEAIYLRTSAIKSFLRMRAGNPARLPPPEKGFEKTLSESENRMLSEMSKASVVGSAAAVHEGIDSFVKRTGADELIITCQIYEHEKRLQSYSIVADTSSVTNAA